MNLYHWKWFNDFGFYRVIVCSFFSVSSRIFLSWALSVSSFRLACFTPLCSSATSSFSSSIWTLCGKQVKTDRFYIDLFTKNKKSRRDNKIHHFFLRHTRTIKKKQNQPPCKIFHELSQQVFNRLPCNAPFFFRPVVSPTLCLYHPQRRRVCFLALGWLSPSAVRSKLGSISALQKR